MTNPVPTWAAIGRHRLRYDDYLVLPDDGRRYEILDGELAVSPAPRPWHQTVSRRIQFALYAQLELTGQGQVFNAPIDLVLSDHDILQPDLLYVTADQREIVTDRAVEGPPALVIEILSPTTRRRDILVKSPLYARLGVPRYWIVDPELDRIEALVLVDGAYQPERTAAAPETLELLGAKLDLGMIFNRR